MEHKTLGFELKQQSEDDDFFFFSGLASTNDLDRGDDRFIPGAFTESLKTIRPVVLWVHQMREPIGVIEETTETPDGLFIKAKLPKNDTLVSGRVIPQIKVGSVRAMSVGFEILERKFETRDDVLIMEIQKANLFEISPVPIPMNPNAVITDFKDIPGVEFKDAHRTIFAIDTLLSGENGALKKMDGADVAQLKKIAESYLSRFKDTDAKAYKFEDVKDVSDKEGFGGFLKSTGLFTKSAREYLAGLLSKRSDSDRKEGEIISGFSNGIKELKQILAKG